MSNTDVLKDFFTRTIDGLARDATAKGQKAPINKLRFEVDELSGSLYAPHYFQYLIIGRGPGKQPPPDDMTAWAEANPDILARFKAIYKYITSQQLGYLIGRKIAREGTDIYSGKKEGIDLLGVMDEHAQELLKQLAHNEAIKVATELMSAVKAPITVAK